MSDDGNKKGKGLSIKADAVVGAEVGDNATSLLEKIGVNAVNIVGLGNWLARKDGEAKKIRQKNEYELAVQDEVYKKKIAEHQQNRNEIGAKVIPHLTEESDTDKIDKDWLNRVREEIKLVSDEDMQELWAKLIAQEANNPGTFPRRTINIITSMDKADALAFEKICAFSIKILGRKSLFIHDWNNKIYTDKIDDNYVTYDDIARLADLNLLRFEFPSQFSQKIKASGDGATLEVIYHEELILIKLKNGENKIIMGNCQFTLEGESLAKICRYGYKTNFVHYIKKKLIEQKLNLIEED